MMRGSQRRAAPERGTDLYPYHPPYQGEYHAISTQSARNQHAISTQSARNQHAISVVPIWIAFSSSNGSPESS